MVEFNEGYEIIAAETYHSREDMTEDRVVLGQKKSKYGNMFVTWESVGHPNGKVDYFWGHYHGNEDKARADYHRRLADHYTPSDES